MTVWLEKRRGRIDLLMYFALCHRPARKVGELHVVLGLEDLGPVNPQRLLAGAQVQWEPLTCNK